MISDVFSCSFSCFLVFFVCHFSAVYRPQGANHCSNLYFNYVNSKQMVCEWIELISYFIRFNIFHLTVLFCCSRYFMANTGTLAQYRWLRKGRGQHLSLYYNPQIYLLIVPLRDADLASNSCSICVFAAHINIALIIIIEQHTWMSYIFLHYSIEVSKWYRPVLCTMRRTS